jgi:26S proteasome regulatory subunit N8
VSTLSTKVGEKVQSLRGLKARLEETKSYMDKVVDGSLPVNHEIMGHLQDAFNLLPNLNLEDYVKGFNTTTNDMMLVVYLSSLIRSVIALHDLINNKVLNKEHERKVDGADAEKENEKPEKPTAEGDADAKEASK